MDLSDHEVIIPPSLSLDVDDEVSQHITLPAESGLLYESDILHVPMINDSHGDNAIIRCTMTGDNIVVLDNKSESVPTHEIASVETVETTPTLPSDYLQLPLSSHIDTSIPQASSSNAILYRSLKLSDDESMLKQRDDDDIVFQHFVTFTTTQDNIETLTSNGAEISQLSADYEKDIKNYYKRQKDRIKKAQLRANPVFHKRENIKARERMKMRRQDPAFRELERDKDRIRRRKYRQQNAEARDKEKEKDRVYKKTIREKRNTPSDSEEIVSVLNLVTKTS